jgi:phosphatidylinositol alpha 1,6-mannosyltransferase
MPLRVALVTDTYLPEINGVTTVLRAMREGLRAQGHNVLVVAPRYGGNGAEEPDVIRRGSVAFPWYPAVRLSFPFGGSLARSLDRFQPSLVHVVTEGPLGTIGRRWAIRHRVPLVTSFHTDFPRYAGRYLGAWAINPVRRYCRWFHRPALVTQTPSEETARELRSFGLGTVMVWGRGVDPHCFTPERRSESRRHAMGNGVRPVILHVGRLAREKDVAVLVETFNILHEKLGDQAGFEVSGDGPEAPSVRQALPFAHHHGFLDRERLADLYADSDLFVFPSPTETCGLVALEAMASGLPVIAANQGGVLENLRPEVNGLLAPAGDAAAFAEATGALVQDPDRRAGMSAGARAWAVGHSWERELDELERVYRQLAFAPQPNGLSMAALWVEKNRGPSSVI